MQDNGFNLHAKEPAAIVREKQQFNKKYTYPFLQTSFGGLNIVGGAAICATGVGCVLGIPMAAIGADDYYTGINNFGKSRQQQNGTLRENALIKAGLTPEQAFYTSLAGDFIIGDSVSAFQVSKSSLVLDQLDNKVFRQRVIKNNIYRDDSYRYLWSLGRARDFNNNLAEHWNKHKSQFPEFVSQNDYYNYALNFYNNPPRDTLDLFHKSKSSHFHVINGCYQIKS